MPPTIGMFTMTVEALLHQFFFTCQKHLTGSLTVSSSPHSHQHWSFWATLKCFHSYLSNHSQKVLLNMNPLTNISLSPYSVCWRYCLVQAYPVALWCWHFTSWCWFDFKLGEGCWLAKKTKLIIFTKSIYLQTFTSTSPSMLSQLPCL